MTANEDGGEDRHEDQLTVDERTATTYRRTFLKGSAAALGASAIPVSAVRASTEDGNNDERRRTPDTARSSEGMVSTVHPQATAVGVDVLQNGGNAIDAAVAVQFALNVTQPHGSGIGGGGFMLVYVAEEDELYAIDNRERAPLGATADMFLDDQGEPIPFEKRITLGEAVGVPGTLRACDVVLKRFGTQELSKLITPGIELASGACPVTVDEHLASVIQEEQSKFNDAARSVFTPGGTPLKAGETLVQEDLAETFRQIKNKGIGAFYGGEIASATAGVVQKHGGSMTEKDLARYNVTIDHPDVGEYGDLTVRTQSLPSSGGLTIAQILQLLEKLDLRQYGRRSPETYHALIEAFHLAYADRGEYMGDKALVDVPWQGLLDEEYVDQRRSLINFESADLAEVKPGNPWDHQPGQPYRIVAQNESNTAPSERTNQKRAASSLQSDLGQTTHFTTADSEGNLVSWTSTIEQFFGTGIMVPDHGFMLNNELTDFDAKPGGPNEVEPTKRPLSSTSPTIVFKDGAPFMTVGSPGGKTIITTVAQIILNVAEFGMSPAEAIAEPRLYDDVDPEVIWEPGLPSEARQQLQALGHEFADEPMPLGNAQAIFAQDGAYLGVADGRRDGSVVGL
ncbi:gamma-glutamyltransferase [Halocatena marina]|uniref:gamma-glutamyltransferase n=1 Tax=Halocatena marina TaxID=2934937 RepID=UPI002225B347|nr:gamma-glutamyltransferase [Halocatena marina]